MVPDNGERTMKREERASGGDSVFATARIDRDIWITRCTEYDESIFPLDIPYFHYFHQCTCDLRKSIFPIIIGYNDAAQSVDENSRQENIR